MLKKDLINAIKRTWGFAFENLSVKEQAAAAAELAEYFEDEVKRVEAKENG